MYVYIHTHHFAVYVKVKVAQSCLTLCDPMDYTIHGILQARILEWVAFLLQGIFPTQGSNPSLLHCGRILYQLRHQGSPITWKSTILQFKKTSETKKNSTKQNKTNKSEVVMTTTILISCMKSLLIYPTMQEESAGLCHVVESSRHQQVFLACCWVTVVSCLSYWPQTPVFASMAQTTKIPIRTFEYPGVVNSKLA